MLLATLLAHDRRVADFQAAEAVDLLAGGRGAMVHGELVRLQRIDGDGDKRAGNQCLDGAGALSGTTMVGASFLLHGYFSCMLGF